MTTTMEPPKDCPHRNAPRAGRKAASDWPANEGPLKTLANLLDCPTPRRWPRFYTRQPSETSRTTGYRPSWVDHPYRLRLDDGRWCYLLSPPDIP